MEGSVIYGLQNIETGEYLAPFKDGLRWPRVAESRDAIQFGNAGEAARYKRANTYNPADWSEVLCEQ